MQLKNIRGQMCMAACALLQVGAPGAQADVGEWDVDTAVLFYGESDGRVQALEPAIYAGYDFGDDERIDLRLVVDALTGATPNGAHASSVAQTFTTPSGHSSYTAAPGETPLDDTFRDTRIAFGADWTMPLDRMSRIIWGANVSGEHDYFSLGASATYARDFNNRNTTFTAGFAFNNDNIHPEGEIPIEFSPMRAPGATNRAMDNDNKTITDFIVGITQVVDRKTLVQLNLSMGTTDGYLNDPYKIVTVVDPVTGLPTNLGLSNINADALPYVYEKRPDSRQKNSLFLKTVRHLDEDVINFSYRYFWDDWDIKSHTLDLKYRYELDDSYLQPHVRYYTQSAANFYRHNLVQGTDVDAGGNVLVDYASHDYRLAESNTLTLGLKYGVPMDNDSEFSIRGEFITQSIDNTGVPVGEETPNLDALVLQLNYSFLW